MNIKAIIASLVLGSSSIAMASPGVTFSATAQGAYGTTVVRDHRVDDYRPAPIVQPAPVVQPAPSGIYYRNGWHREPMPPVYRPVTLASDMHFAPDGRTSITVGAQAGRFNTLQISACAGPTFIKQVYVQFDNGQEQVVRSLNRTLTGSQSLTLDLDGNHRAIRRIVVYGGTSGGWRWQRASGTFTVTAA
jgi:hypothetical protein